MSRDVGANMTRKLMAVALRSQSRETDLGCYAAQQPRARMMSHAAQTADQKTSRMWGQPAAVTKSRYDTQDARAGVPEVTPGHIAH